RGRDAAAGLDTDPVEGVVDRVDEIGADPLVEGPLLAAEDVPALHGQVTEVAGVLRRGHLEGELRVLHREEAWGASDPGQVVAVLGGPLEQVEVDLRGGLTRPDEGDALPAQRLVADVEVTGAVRGRAAETLRHGRDHRLGPDPED